MSFHRVSTLKPLHMTIGSASCKISVSTALPVHMRPKIREITHLHTQDDKRRSGHATKLMKIVCEIADTDKMILMLSVKPFGKNPEMSEDDLQKWYESKFGFQVISTNPVLMARQPQQVKPPVGANDE